ncbi:undecaprenyl-diphosphatase UppP [Sphingobium yanoikuyae]|uniref:Undecaprenyl-diphosphatase n=1 Tax=Sphingobium yanoikuyae TaxID=13690 RepID=A0A291N6S2_SPHYA|nr:undecaprenyl-diphosphatase UppP [Sphingobium yanoikuyae]ATI82941.1 undecaprenyl-diphosphatase UppP [Sphingobium yanoikuyae]
MDDPALWFEAACLGLLQGLTEFLPVSSSAHLRIAGLFLGSGKDPGAAFTAITQIGTEAAVLLYFRHDIARIAWAWLRSFRPGPQGKPGDVRMGWLVLLGTVPIVVLGLAFQHAIEHSLRNLYFTASTLLIFGVPLGLADRFGAKVRKLEQLSLGHGLVLGLAQAMALIPGVSRSGGTITAGLMLGYTREAAARYSFLLAVPAVLGSGFYQLWKSWGQAGGIGLGPTLLATLIAFVVGYGVIVAFLKLVSSRSYLPFVLYRLILASCLFALLATGRIAPMS